MPRKALRWLPTAPWIKPTLPATAHSHPHPAGHHLMQPFLTMPLSTHPALLAVNSDKPSACLPEGGTHSASHRTGLFWSFPPKRRSLREPFSDLYLLRPHLSSPALFASCHSFYKSSAEGSIQGRCNAGHHASVCHRGHSPCLHTCWQASGITPVRMSGILSGFIHIRALEICGSKGFLVFHFNTEGRSVFGFKKWPVSLDLLHAYFAK